MKAMPMDGRRAGHARFGGPWTETKLDMLESYLNAYTTALKDQPFRLVYIDAFAGTGRIQLRDDDSTTDFLSGSSERAMKITDKPFDRLVFVEKDVKRCNDLRNLCKQYPDRNVCIKNSEANNYLRNLQEDWHNWRGVLFLDPFATEVEWKTIETIASFKALDTWILFPVSAIARMLPTFRKPNDVSEEWAERLTRIYGDRSWEGLYEESTSLFGDSMYERMPGVSGLVRIYKHNLEDLFRSRFHPKSKVFYNSRHSPLFEFIFCVGNPKGIPLARRIASHILSQ